ncbi:MAG: UDP-3-O-(3-hydroxymyristoyl)glucosamine N-acyltransferase [Saprospiraceae bacterium]|jgi:UDP-3-O-[3-hydroxymyristoyl] glucosamine N-acyltransferase
MKLDQPWKVKDLAQLINAEVIGDGNTEIIGINEIHQVGLGDLTFVDVEKYYNACLNSEATAIIINKRITPPEGKVLLYMENPFAGYNSLVLYFRPVRPMLGPIGENCKISEDCIIEPNVTIGHGVSIGKNVHIQANSVIGDYTIIEDQVMIQYGSIIGADGFYFKKTKEGYQKWRSCGRVVIESNVDIGCGCSINRGISGDTVIGRGSKLDSHVHVGHDVKIGKHCLFAAQVGIAGNTIIEDQVTVYGQVGIIQNLRISSNSTIMAKSLVTKDVPPNSNYFGIPAKDKRNKMRELATIQRISRGD